MKSKRLWLLSGCVTFAMMFNTPAFSTADGPDAWRVINVAADDALNVRFGPTTAYDVKLELPYNQRGLQQVTCIPLTDITDWFAMTEGQKSKISEIEMSGWCLISLKGINLGWVNSRFLGEDSLGN